MGNHRASIITIKVTLDNVVKTDIATETTYGTVGQSAVNDVASKSSSSQKSWSLQVPSSNEVCTSTKEGNDSKLKRKTTRPRSLSSSRQRHSSGESCISTVSDGDLRTACRKSTRSRSPRLAPSPRRSLATPETANSTSFVRVASMPKSCNPSRQTELNVIETTHPVMPTPRVRPKSWNPSRQPDDLFDAHGQNETKRTIARPKSCCSVRQTSQYFNGDEDYGTSKIDSKEIVSTDNGLDGQTISHFYKIWNIPNRNKVLGRGKLELPDSLKRKEKYRNCGCQTRNHVVDCRSQKCCSPI